jgi:maltose alpha-D-glucosyltransferase/alpha-amylase
VTTIKVDRVERVLTLAGLGALDGQPLLEWMRARRWFGAKAAATSAKVVDVVPLPWDDARLGIAIVAVETSEGRSLYQLPVAVRRTKVEGIASIEAAEGEGNLLDALDDPIFQRGLAAAMVKPEVFKSERGGEWRTERIGSAALKLPPESKITVGSAEQSNSSLIFDGAAILKLFRKLERGIQPDVEMTRFLTLDAGFAWVPPMFATITYRDAEGEATAGMLQEFMPAATDAWSHVLGAVKPGAPTSLPRAERGVSKNDFEQLGRTTRELHEALAGDAAEKRPDFAPVAATAGDVERWAQRTKEMIREALGLLARQRTAKKLAPERAAEAEALVGRRDHYLMWVEEIADRIGDDAGSRIRVHGDYHLGQVLRTKSDSFVIIDFEGEPTRSLADRREKTSALKDVAGMLRSLAYAAATFAKPDAKGDKRTMAERELASGRWERDARAAFLRGYTSSASKDRSLLPNDPKKFEALLSLFEGEKAFYELAYELNHRPGWEWIPMRGISRLLVR